MKKFRKWNARLSYGMASGLFCLWSFSDRRAYVEHPYSWLWILIPIAGIAGLHTSGWQRDYDNRVRNLKRRRDALRDELMVPKKGVDGM